MGNTMTSNSLATRKTMRETLDEFGTRDEQRSNRPSSLENGDVE